MYWLTVPICALAVLVGLTVVRYFPISYWPPVLALMALTLVTENFAFELPLTGSVSLSFAMTFAAMLHSGPLAAILCALAGSISLEEYRAHKPLILRLYNASQLSLSAGVAGLVYMGAGGLILSAAVPAVAGGLVAALAAAATFFFMNVLLVSVAVSVITSQSLAAVLQDQRYLSYGASHIVLALLGLIVAYLLLLGSWVGLVLLVLPFMSARRTFRVYVELSEAYTTTVRSLVAAIEAKDPYTRGHSERVAVLARVLAERAGLPTYDVDLVERAALLHDVGKIGVSIATLTSSQPLTAEEVREIRRHPTIGSDLLEGVEFLAETVPIIRHHHEHIDGAGYPDGLVGDEIPLLSRVLATVDAYDAMTSDRAYRAAMTDERASAEMIRVAGQQLDAGMVAQLVTIITERSEAPLQ